LEAEHKDGDMTCCQTELREREKSLIAASYESDNSDIPDR